MTRQQIYRELQKILDWQMRGKITPFKYNQRYKELMTLLKGAK